MRLKVKPKTDNEAQATDQDQETQEIEFHFLDSAGRGNLPKIGQRALWVLKQGATMKNKRLSIGLIAFGYRFEDETVYLPLYKEKVSIKDVTAWKLVEGPSFWNGTGHSATEALDWT